MSQKTILMWYKNATYISVKQDENNAARIWNYIRKLNQNDNIPNILIQSNPRLHLREFS